MAELIVLIDPNDANLEALIEQINILKPRHVWVGCSTSSGEATVAVFDGLKVPASLYPGTVDQILAAHGLAECIYLPDPLIYSNPVVETMKSTTLRFVNSGKTDRGKYHFMQYVLLHPDCTAARHLGVHHVPSDQEVLDKLGAQGEVHPAIYLEGGSRNKQTPITVRLDLVRRIREAYPEAKTICAGGIATPEQVEILDGLCSYVLVSHAVHQNPEDLGHYMRAVAS